MKTRTWNLLFVAVLTVLALVWALTLWNGTTSYQPAYRQPEAIGKRMPALVPRLVFVIIDGVRYDLAETMSCVQQIREVGASAKSIAVLPSMSEPSWTTLVSGARPEINGATLFNAAYKDLHSIRVDHLFQLAKQAGLTTALAGHEWWKKMVPAGYLDKVHFVRGFDAEGDREAAEAGAEFVQDPGVNFLLLYLGEYDEISHSVGGASPVALAALRRSNEDLCMFLSYIDLSDTVVVVAADHGQLNRGGHGGDDRDVLETLLVMAGPRVRPGSYQTVQEPDVALTIAALLGLPLLRSGQGRVLYEFLDVSDAEKARGQALLVAQRLAQADAYLSGIQAPSLPAQLRMEASRLDGLLNDGRYEEADRQASVILEQTGQQVERARAAKVKCSRLAKLPIALVALAVILATFIANWRAKMKVPLLLALAGVLAYHAFYAVRGYAYSLSATSSMGGLTGLALTLVGGAVAALVLGLLLLWLSSLGDRRPGTASLSADSISAFCTGLVGMLWVQALVAYVGNGGLGSWNIIVPKLSFLLLLSLLQVGLAGLLSVLVMVVALVLLRLRRGRSPSS